MSCKHQTLPKGHYCCFCGEMLITVCELFISNGTTPCVPRCKLCKDWGESKKCEEKNVEDPCDCSSCLYGRESAKKLITETHTVEPEGKRYKLPKDFGKIAPNQNVKVNDDGTCQTAEEPKPECPECEECGIAEKSCGKFCSPCRRTIEKRAMVNATILDMKAEEKAFRTELLSALEFKTIEKYADGCGLAHPLVDREKLESLKKKFL